MKVLELFSSYGTASFALKRIFGEQGYKLVGYGQSVNVVEKIMRRMFNA